MTVIKGIIRGLQEMLDHAHGKIELRSNFVEVKPPRDFTAIEIREIRDRLNMSQGFFAGVIGVSKKTVESWEYGRGKPSGAASRLLTIAETDPDSFERYGFVQW